MKIRCSPHAQWFWWLVLPAFAAVALGICTGLWHLAYVPRSGIRVEQLEADLRQQLPLGSPREKVEACFTSRGIKASIMMAADGRELGLAASIPNNSFAEAADIRIIVYFDEHGRLERMDILRFVYSL